MIATARHYATRGVAALAVLAAVALGIQSIRDHDRARNVFQQAIEAEPEDLRGLLPEIAAQRGRLRPDLERVEGDTSAPVRHRANARLLLHREQPTADRAAKLRARLAEAGPDEVALIRDTLATDPATARGDLLLSALRDDSSTDAARLRLACALAGLSPVDAEDWNPAAGALVRGPPRGRSSHAPPVAQAARPGARHPRAAAGGYLRRRGPRPDPAVHRRGGAGLGALGPARPGTARAMRSRGPSPRHR